MLEHENQKLPHQIQSIAILQYFTYWIQPLLDSKCGIQQWIYTKLLVAGMASNEIAGLVMLLL